MPELNTKLIEACQRYINDPSEEREQAIWDILFWRIPVKWKQQDVSVSVNALIKWLVEYERLVVKLKGRYHPCQVVAWLRADLMRALDFAMETMELDD